MSVVVMCVVVLSSLGGSISAPNTLVSVMTLSAARSTSDTSAATQRETLA